jgi:aspartyl-tRNA(Asn)/glutamyl-tRNA(Gln) amidotransferase subunit A
MTGRLPLTRGQIEAALIAARAAQESLRCWIDLDPSGARAAAGATGPLQGLTGAVKGNIAMRALPNTGGSAARRDAVAGQDAQAVGLLRAAGACLLGTANLHEGALGATTRNEAFGWCQNPRRPGHTPGGSSGGSGAAVAAGLADFALGTDTMGSVRIPAAYCGVFGFKPGGSWLDQAGVIPLKASFDQVGPLARDAATLVAVARVLGAPDPEEVSGCRFGVLEGWEEVPHALTQALAPALRRVEEAGATLVPVRLPDDLGPADLILAGFTLCAREAADVHWAREMADPASGLSDGFRALLAYGLKADSARLARAQALVQRARESVRGLLDRQGLDGLLSPTAPETAFAHETAPPRQAGFTGLANFADLPSVSVPAGALDGLPVGLMLTAAPGRDGLALGFASLFGPFAP